MKPETKMLIVKTFEEYCNYYVNSMVNDRDYVVSLMRGFCDALNKLEHISVVEYTDIEEDLELWRDEE